MKKYLIISLLIAILSATAAWASDDDAGLVVSATVEKKLNKKASIGFETEFRSRNNLRTADRVSLGVNGEYKLHKWLKLDAGYQFLVDNNEEKITYNVDDDGEETISYNNWRPSYWGTRHRVFASVTGSYKIGRVSLSLRERWRYTYRPEHTTTRYDFDNEYWEDTQVKSKSSHVLRSRLKLNWDIPKCKIDPWISAELFNDWSLEKIRYSVGADYSLRKKHTFTVFYRYQDMRGAEDNEHNIHDIGLSYKFKF